MTFKHRRQFILAIIFIIFFSLFAGTLIKLQASEEEKTEEKTPEQIQAEEEEQEREKDKERNVGNAKSTARVVYPIDYMILFEGRDWIAGVLRNTSGETVNMRVIEAKTGYELSNEDVEVEDNGLFMNPVEYVPGINEIYVNDFHIFIYYQEDEETEPPAKFKEALIHQSVPDLCEECHDIFEDESNSFPLNDENINNICDNCHRSRIYNRLRKEYKHTHKPLTEEGCVACHQVHVSTNEHMLRMPQNELCATCHQNFIQAVKKNKFIHLGDIFDSICTKCHNPHSSNIKNLIRDVRKGICKKCHSAFTGEKENIEYKSIHQPVVQGKCYLCHNIHTGINKMFLIKESTTDTCLSCHKGKTSTGHGSKLANCIECHDPHLSDKESLFTDKGIKKCLSCHKDLNYKKDIKEKTECQGCHNPHLNENVEIAKVSCGNCHELNKLTIKHSDVKPSETCTKCHGLHGDGEKGLLKKNTHPLKPLKEKRCKGCHTSKDVQTARTSCLECHKGIYSGKHPNTFENIDSCIGCHNVHGGGELKLLAKNQHKPFSERKCEVCHKNIEESLLLPEKAKTGTLCLSCHKDIDLDIDRKKEEKKEPPKTPQPPRRQPPPVRQVQEVKPVKAVEPPKPYEVMHKPFKNRECIKCHETHVSKYEKLVRNEGKKLCYSCHKSKEIDEKGKPMMSVHQPISSGDCLKCHNPHGSNYEKMLAANGQDLCFSCHDNFIKGQAKNRAKMRGGITAKDLPDLKVIHKPILEKGCMACHSPHASKVPGLLKTEVDKLICYNCHMDFTINDDDELKKSIHEPVSKEDCFKCHEVHASDNARLLKKVSNNLCVGCHKLARTHHNIRQPDLERMAKVPESFIVENTILLCINCHNPHSSDEVRLFADFKKKLCLLCHSSEPQ